MAALNVGQRVKKVRGEHNLGNTGVVSSVPLAPANADIGCDITVKMDNAGISCEGVRFPAGEVCACFSDQWEPILPEGHKAGDFSYEELLEHLETLSHENA